jgi:mono/diheme cytochrome c family protein
VYSFRFRLRSISAHFSQEEEDMKIRLALAPVSLAVLGLFLAGCSKSDPAPAPEAKAESAKPAPAEKGEKTAPAPATNEGKAPAAAAAADPVAEAKQIYTTRCVVCHGAAGKGDGAGAANLNPKPANYADAKWQGSVTDQQIKDAIVKGGAAIGKSPLMPPNADLAAKEAVLAELVKMIRGFGPPK